MTRSTIETEGSGPKLQTLGKYQLLKRLAVGGMAEIFLARATGIQGFEKYVVLKRILPQNAADPHFIAMFLDEARLAARLDHHNIAQVYDIGQDNDQYFFAMEYLHGTDVHSLLHAAVTQGKRIPLEHALTIAAGVAAGLKYAHEKCDRDGSPLGIVHRDVAPSNVLITYEGGVKLVDFGIARAQTKSTQTDAGRIKGKLSYMSPEQCRGMSLDARSDIFSLGIVLYEMTTMTRLFRLDRRGKLGVMERIVKGDVPSPSTRVSGYPAALELVVKRALQVSPDDRYQSAGDFLRDIERVAAGERMTMSTAALAQYIREVVGYRPEPWEDDSLDSAADELFRSHNDLPAPLAPTELAATRAPSVAPPLIGNANASASANAGPTLPASMPGWASAQLAASVPGPTSGQFTASVPGRASGQFTASMPGPTSAQFAASVPGPASGPGPAAPVASAQIPGLPATLDSSGPSGSFAIPAEPLRTTTSGAVPLPPPDAMKALGAAAGQRWRRALALSLTAAVVVILVVIAVQVEPDPLPAAAPASGDTALPTQGAAAQGSGAVALPDDSRVPGGALPGKDGGVENAMRPVIEGAEGEAGSDASPDAPGSPQTPGRPTKKRTWDPSSPFPPSAED